MRDDILESHRFTALAPGPRLLVLGAVHGNEGCGPAGMARAVADLREGRLALTRGSVTFLPVANPKARRQSTREGDRNLNRDLRERPFPVDFEDRVGNRLCPILREHEVLLDIHSFTGEGTPFVFAGPDAAGGEVDPFVHAQAEWAFAAALGVDTVVHGWQAAYGRHLAGKAAAGFPVESLMEGVGTTEYMRFAGGYGVTIECGRHADAAAADVAHEAIRRAFAQLGLSGEPPPAPTVRRAIRIVDSLLCEREGDVVARDLRTNDAVTAGQALAHRADGTAVTAPRDGYVVFPNPTAKPGQQLCYFGIASDRLSG